MANLGYIASRLGTHEITTVTLEHSVHIVNVDHDRDRALAATAAFVEQLPVGSAA